MKIHFYSFLDSVKQSSYITEASFDLENNTYTFPDLSLENTKINLKLISNNEVIIERIGRVNSKMDFILNHTTTSFYNSKDLNFEFGINTKELKINSNSVSITYEYYYLDSLVGKIKIAVLIKDSNLLN
jgi:uncharacterized beta-barrel protein YwiB (DUF1934 family)